MHLIDSRTGLERLTREDCLRLLGEDEVGRLVIVDGDAPHVFPVNYVLDGEAIVFRTDPGTKLAKGPRRRACFEIDSFDRELRAGWSVIGFGRLEEVTRFNSRLYEHVRGLGVDPWAGDKHHWMRFTFDRLTGRRVRQHPGRDRVPGATRTGS